MSGRLHRVMESIGDGFDAVGAALEKFASFFSGPSLPDPVPVPRMAAMLVMFVVGGIFYLLDVALLAILPPSSFTTWLEVNTVWVIVGGIAVSIVAWAVVLLTDDGFED